MRKFFYFLMLFSMAFAGAPSGTVGDKGVLPNIFTPEATETDFIIHKILKPYFGYDMGIDYQEGAFSEFSRIFLFGILCVGAIILVFNIWASAVDTARSGKLLAGRGSLSFTATRTVASIGVLLPLGSSGLCAIQYLVLWLTANGVLFADTLWENFTDNPYQGVVYYTPQTKMSVVKALEKAFIYETCLRAGREATTINSSGNSYNWRMDIKKAGEAKIVKMPKIEGKDLDGFSEFSTGRDIYMAPEQKYRYVSGDEKWFLQDKAVCGTLTVSGENFIPPISDVDFVELRNLNSELQVAHRQELAKMITSVAPKLADFYMKNPNDKSGFSQLVQQGIDSYGNRLLSIYGSSRKNIMNNESMGAKVEDMKKVGVAGAGAYYFFMAKNLSTVNETLNVVPEVLGRSAEPSKFYLKDEDLKELNKISPKIIPMIETSQKYFYDALENIKLNMNGNEGFEEKGKLLKDMRASDEESSENLGTAFNKFDFGGMKFFSWAISTGDVNENPLVRIQGIGTTMITTAMGVVGATIVGGFFSSFFSSAIVPIFLTLGVAILIPGLVLGFYLPMIPFLLWTAGLFGYLVLVVEAFFGAPLWAMMFLTRSDGSFIGRQESGVMMILSLTFKLPLMLLGYVVAQKLLTIIVYIVNYFYSFAVGSIYFSTNPITGTLILLVAIYTYFIFLNKAMKEMFGLIHYIPDNMFKWIGNVFGNLGQMTNAIEAGTASSSVGALQQTLNTAQGAVGGVVRTLNDNRLNNDKLIEGDRDQLRNKFDGGHNAYDAQMNDINKTIDEGYQNYQNEQIRQGKGDDIMDRDGYIAQHYPLQGAKLKDLELGKSIAHRQEALNNMETKGLSRYDDPSSELNGKTKEELQNEINDAIKIGESRGLNLEMYKNSIGQVNPNNAIKAKWNSGGYSHNAKSHNGATASHISSKTS